MPLYPFSKNILTIHDIFPISKRYSSEKFIKKAKKRILQSIKRSQYIHTASFYVKSEILKYTPFKDEKKIFVIPFGADHIPKTLIDKPTIKKKYNLPEDYMVYVGTIEKRKNIVNIVRAAKEVPIPLVIIGGLGYKGKILLNLIKKEKNIIYLGYIAGEETYSICKWSKLWLFPSLDEGFGIPVLEALTLNIPIITSPRGAIPEIGKENSIYAKPTDHKDIIKKIFFVLNNPKTIKEMIRKNTEITQEYSWKNFIKKLLTVYHHILWRERK
jgi:glycosyltransferase involved in cell wall biosynthesis